MTEPVVGVIGGMGPDATVELMRRVLAATPVTDDADHIHMIVDNNPKVPSRIRALIDKDGDNPGPTIASMAQKLEAFGSDFLVMPCNTAHHYWDYAQKSVNIPVWHIVDLTLTDVKTRNEKNSIIGLLASPALRRIQLYEPWCEKHGLKTLYPDKESKILEIIKNIKSRCYTNKDIAQLNTIANELTANGADSIVIGCTEFSLISNYINVDVPIFDTLDMLANRIVEYVKTQ